ncbi:DUF4271 domain-containing protein [Leptobacterium sp. I13]|uniref:DUF4271 domain-containing protein n=1 Tax=Leptobacterium meishanense TaxID=3128904 RepID=UPI0030EF4B9E
MEIINRHIEYYTLETSLLLLCGALIVISKILFEERFQTFITLLFSNKYFKVYGKEVNLNFSLFNVLLFIVQIIIYGFLAQFVFDYYKLPVSYPLFTIIASLGLFVLFKYYFEKLIATIVMAEAFSEQYNFHKVSYRSFIAIIIFPLIALYIYSPLNSPVLLWTVIFIFLTLNFIAFILTILNHQKIILPRLFYFILYLCALEIAPYVIAIKLVFYNNGLS